jgi:thioredoxin 1
MPKQLTDDQFTKVIEEKKPVLVDFWAEWCGPCHRVAPVLEDISSSRDDIEIAKLDIDQYPSVAQNYQVMSIPTLIIFEEGKEIARLVGAQPKAAIETAIEAALSR